MTIVDYKDLKPVVTKSCTRTDKYTNMFVVDDVKMNQLLESQNLMVLPVGLQAHRVKMEELYSVAEYFIGENLQWFDDSKFLTTLICIDKEDLNEEVLADIELLKVKREEHPDIDYVKILANILATYHCYFIMVVSYISSDPGKYGKGTYFINCRANKVVIKDPNYVYNSKDIG